MRSRDTNEARTELTAGVRCGTPNSTGRQRRVGAGEAAAGREADPRARQGASVEADARRGQIPLRGELAEAEGVTRSFVNRLLGLTLLAPDIVEAILEGRQPKGLQLEELTRTMPSGWEDQRDSFAACWDDMQSSG